MLNQVSVFAENTKGALRKMTAVLAAADVNIYSMLASDSAEFGIIRLVLTDPERALTELKKAGYQCHIDKVIAVEMGDTPGSLDAILKHLEEANVSLDYLYISYDPRPASRSSSSRRRNRRPRLSCAARAISLSTNSDPAQALRKRSLPHDLWQAPFDSDSVI